MKKTLILAAAVLAFAAISVQATVVIDTYPAGGSIAPFGEPDTATYGQTFLAPDSVLNSFQMTLNGGLSVPFQFYVAAWTGTMASGPMLYTSPVYNNFPGGNLIVTPNVSVTPGSEYVAFISTSGLQNGVDSTVSVAWPGTAYGGGKFVFFNNGNNFGALTTQVWDSTQWWGRSDSLAFRAEFSSVVPEPSTCVAGALITLSLAGASLRKLRKNS